MASDAACVERAIKREEGEPPSSRTHSCPAFNAPDHLENAQSLNLAGHSMHRRFRQDHDVLALRAARLLDAAPLHLVNVTTITRNEAFQNEQGTLHQKKYGMLVERNLVL